MSAPQRIVLDASVAIALLREERYSPAVRESVAEWLRAETPLLVPPHLWLEVTNALQVRHRVPSAVVVAAIRELDELGLETIAPDRPQLLLAVHLAEQHGLTSYDAAHVALADSTDARVATFDARLARAAGSRAVPLGDLPSPARGVHDCRTPYGADAGAGDGPGRAPSWATWPGTGAYLARLRREAAVRAADGERS
jgi:predicted nucleic acid-binding protein